MGLRFWELWRLNIKMEYENVKLGECPFCNSTNYERGSLEPIDDFIVTRCECQDCNKEFKEYFGLDEVAFDTKEETGIILNKTLFQCDKDTIGDWAEQELLMKEEQFSNKDHHDDYKIRVNRILNIMRGRLIRGD